MDNKDSWFTNLSKWKEAFRIFENRIICNDL